jgi:hypothetical protein
MTEERGPSVPTAIEAYKHLRLPVIDDAYENLHMLTVLSPWALTALMLADAPSPRGSDADLAIAGYVVGAL